MPPQQRTFHEEQILDQQSEFVDCTPTTTTAIQDTSHPYQVTNQAKPGGNVLTHRLHEHLDTKNTNNKERDMRAETRSRLASDGLIRYPTEDEPKLMNSHAIFTGPMGNSAEASIGQDLWKSRKENPQKRTQLSSRSHPRHLVGKRTAQKDTIIDITSDSQVNSNLSNLRQLKRVQIPVFSGDKRAYPSWRAAKKCKIFGRVCRLT